MSDFCVMGDLTQEDPADQSLLGSGIALVHLTLSQVAYAFHDPLFMCLGLFGFFFLCPWYLSPPSFMGNGELIVG